MLDVVYKDNCRSLERLPIARTEDDHSVQLETELPSGWASVWIRHSPPLLPPCLSAGPVGLEVDRLVAGCLFSPRGLEESQFCLLNVFYY